MKYDFLVLSSWLQTEARCQCRKEIAISSSNQQRQPHKSLPALTTILHGANKPIVSHGCMNKKQERMNEKERKK